MMGKIPSEVNIAGIEYSVKEVEQLADRHELGGQVHYAKAEIILEPSMSETKKEQVFVHEVLHAMFVEAGYEEHEEEMVLRLGKVLYQVLKQNKLYFGDGV